MGDLIKLWAGGQRLYDNLEETLFLVPIYIGDME